jgi:NTE family protein
MISHPIDTSRVTGDASVIDVTPPGDEVARAISPVRYPEPFLDKDRQPEDGIGLCLSGGGYRAMLFHLGSLWRLNELGYLPKLKRISSVSGGSITAAFLGLKWNELDWKNDVAGGFQEKVVSPIRALAGKTIDKGAILGGALLPFVSISEKVEKAYRKHLYGDATLQDLPDENAGAPRFTLNATNVQTGAIWRFAKPYMADWRVGQVNHPKTSLSFAVAASSAFPPLLSPAKMKLDGGLVQQTEGADLHRKPYTTDIVLTDGGVYDNLGLETVWKRYKTVLVSDGGGQMEPEEKPASKWIHHGLRITSLLDNQVRSLRKRQVVGSFERGSAQGGREGAYWRIGGRIDDYSASGKLPCPYNRTVQLAQTPTRLAELSAPQQERLINWGYALCDAALRTWVKKDAPAPSQFPYPDTGV